MSKTRSHLLKRIVHKIIVKPLRLLEEGTRIDTNVEPKPVELQMIWPQNRLANSPFWSVPEGYYLRTYHPSDKIQFFQIMERAGFPGWNDIEIQSWLQRILPEGFFFLIDQKTNKIVATAMALHNPTPFHPFGGSLSSVAVDPEYQGQGLGFVISAAATTRLLKGGYHEIYLLTDAWRLPAIKTYLKMGWIPFPYLDGMREQWESVCEKLEWPNCFENWSQTAVTATVQESKYEIN